MQWLRTEAKIVLIFTWMQAAASSFCLNDIVPNNVAAVEKSRSHGCVCAVYCVTGEEKSICAEGKNISYWPEKCEDRQTKRRWRRVLVSQPALSHHYWRWVLKAEWFSRAVPPPALHLVPALQESWEEQLSGDRSPAPLSLAETIDCFVLLFSLPLPRPPPRMISPMISGPIVISSWTPRRGGDENG